MRIAVGVTGAALIAGVIAGPAAAAPLHDSGITAAELARSLRGAGFQLQQSTDRDGDPLLKSVYEGARFSVYFYECAGSPRCKSVQFAAGWAGRGLTAQQVADWNRTKRLGRSYLDREGDPWVEMDVDLEHGATTEAVANDIDRWVAVLRKFRKYIGR